jgi:hypothetical protein
MCPKPLANETLLHFRYSLNSLTFPFRLCDIPTSAVYSLYPSMEPAVVYCCHYVLVVI